MKTFEIQTFATTITTVKANSKEEAMKKFCKLSEEQKERRSRIVDITCSFNPYDEYEDINEYVEEVEE